MPIIIMGHRSFSENFKNSYTNMFKPLLLRKFQKSTKNNQNERNFTLNDETFSE